MDGASSTTDWNQQLLNNDLATIAQLSEKVNDFFVGLTSDFQPLSQQDYVKLFIEIPSDKSPGPDLFPNRILKAFALELALVVTDIYNSSMLHGVIPNQLKESIVSPIPKCTPPKTIDEDLRPISLTSQISKIVKGSTLKSLLRQIYPANLIVSK